MITRDFIYEDLNRELVNHFQFAVADSYDEFVSFMLHCIQETLNSKVGQEMMQPLRQKAIEMNMSQADWQKRKVNIMMVLFFLILEELPMLKHEMARHLYRELRKEN